MVLNQQQIYHKVFFKNCDEFERVRFQCLLEKNWLHDNYLPKNFDIEDYDGVCVAYYGSEDDPIAFAGQYSKGYPVGVTQIAKRMYGFPKFRGRSYSQLKTNWNIIQNHIIDPLYEINPYKTGFIGMHNRSYKKNNMHFKIFARAARDLARGWSEGDGYINACGGHNHPNCWQNYLYIGDWDMWNPKIITHEEWLEI